MDDHNNLPVVVVDDERDLLNTIAQTLELNDLQPLCFDSGTAALKQLNRDFPGVVVTDINMSPMDGLELMTCIQTIDRELPVILITGHGDISMAVNAIRDGAYEFIEKPFTGKQLVSVIQRALERRHLVLENRALKQELAVHSAPGSRILGNASNMKRLRNRIHQVLDAPADILIHGETGTGKELVARYLHEHSSRRQHPFVAINCGAVPENLIESELFGHESGAFTGAEKARVGKFEYANGGTLFLDEIESMPASLQIKILRVLEERKVERLGSNKLISLDIRIVAATKVDLLQLAEQGNFREDLYYRLNLVKLNIPPLRERLDDVPLLFEHFALLAAERYQRQLEPTGTEFIDTLLQHHWPGNVRELRNAAERHILTDGFDTFEFREDDTLRDIQARATLPERVEQFERMAIEQSLKQNNGCIKDTMVCLGIARKTLYDKMKKYSLTKDPYKVA
ncbi:sigma-54-dependent transcriptional regulator [Endozoicomonadaceae bacterium StTr2]